MRGSTTWGLRLVMGSDENEVGGWWGDDGGEREECGDGGSMVVRTIFLSDVAMSFPT